ncbi:nitrate/nitrite two-component system sensor histidine kinase NarQ [Vibrio cholerae]|uniref:nitrate/nitrite two-component system sensor histidine kinase NarQ n=1 Tax=Vibrio cholerae TaxID=666 RepID=UPI0022F325FF|nr:nitrate/nitrite two-component system sensor histidine kinase NarQ [Vibrio cholerae]
MAKAMLLILFLSALTTGVAIVTLASSLNDAEAVNVSGSMRMQSYRLAYDIQTQSNDYKAHIFLFENSLYSPSMLALLDWTVPSDIQQDYYQLIERWHELKKVLNSDQKAQYLDQVAPFVSLVDGFVLKLQRFSERKLIALAAVGSFGLGGIFAVSLFVVYYIREQVVRPLNAMVDASEKIKNRNFDVMLEETSSTEMGILSRTFNSMAGDLGKLYRGLEHAVNEKTNKLQMANQSLQILYHSSQELTASRITASNFQTILHHWVALDGICALRLEIEEEAGKPLILQEGKPSGAAMLQTPLTLDGHHLGFLYWEAGSPEPDRALIDNFALILSRAIYYNQAQRQAEQLLLMEERATIARELHDSLAQSLSYLKIQLTLLKRSVTPLKSDGDLSKTENIIREIDKGLSDAYTQLRELLTTFRLTLTEGSFGQSLLGMLTQLSGQTDAKIELNNALSSIALDAHQQVHLVQLIREATINAIKHAKATKIKVNCQEQQGRVQVTIEDDGVGFDLQDHKLNHYGMSIMQERAARLRGELKVESAPGKGCKVVLTYQQSEEKNKNEL